MTLNGAAAQLGNALMITPAQNGQAGSAWFQSQQSVTSGFLTTFEFRITPTGSGADGMTFIVHDDVAGTAALAQGGGSLGYTSQPLVPTNTMANLLVVELDTYQNGGFGDPDANHISVHLIPTIPTTANGADEYYSIGRVSPATNLSDGQVHTMCIRYVPGTLDIFLDDTAVPVLSVAFDFLTGGTNLTGNPIAGLNLPNGTAYVGFTGGTGGLNQLNEILSWELGGPACPLNPWEVNSPESSLDIDGLQGTGTGPAVTPTGSNSHNPSRSRSWRPAPLSTSRWGMTPSPTARTRTARTAGPCRASPSTGRRTRRSGSTRTARSTSSSPRPAPAPASLNT